MVVKLVQVNVEIAQESGQVKADFQRLMASLQVGLNVLGKLGVALGSKHESVGKCVTQGGKHEVGSAGGLGGGGSGSGLVGEDAGKDIHAVQGAQRHRRQQRPRGQRRRQLEGPAAVVKER